MNTAFCYVTDGRDDAEMRKWSIRSIRKYCGDVPIYVAAPSFSQGVRDETAPVVHIDDAFAGVFGDVSPMRFSRGSSFPTIVFGKFVLPLIDELSGYDMVVTMDYDTEIVSSGFKDIMSMEIPEPYDVGIVRRSGGVVSDSIASHYPDLTVPGLPYYSVGLITLRGGPCSDVYIDKAREMLRVSESYGFKYPEEYAANMFMSIFPIPDEYHVIPKMPGIRSGGSSDISKALALHYGGPRKSRIRDRWRRQYEEDGVIDLNNIEGTRNKGA